ncbi:hypothetical protein BZA05DRAFT_448039 [Tricharina praecox]|uniref:uncharacterized protein n=1 Tax=Tricharina praecox TaxID=43433 RepID=UPI00221ECB2F|nr:uncharacterized protein BZA05DRAFT_448039 [Tricharina praecox]KAI5844823.1 hypothetical protein BZA05DRAFT_448039 [Tricharina praecox]
MSGNPANCKICFSPMPSTTVPTLQPCGDKGIHEVCWAKNTRDGTEKTVLCPVCGREVDVSWGELARHMGFRFDNWRYTLPAKQRLGT